MIFHRFRIKNFEHVDCESELNFIVYTGADTKLVNYGLGVSGDVTQMTSFYFGKDHALYIDNWYSSPSLAEFLHEKEISVCGIILSLKAKLKKREIEIAHNMISMTIK